ncbi:acyl carrier protein [Streptosporangium album]|uniref:Acyl carrier protein n=1 Tax=Streptosporangium album TaxID=47479 RepID=A0A7W7WD14_9ACTN|nr:phosphopantetheine-binding protein [Streptosporangium album]MBB4942358.1 acyl carrier protein [Streptosporangium album]
MDESRASIAAVISCTVAQVTGRESPREDPHLNLLDDFGVDSLALLEVVEILEKRFQVTIPDEDTGQMRTLGDLMSVLQRLTDPTSLRHR